MQSSSIGSSGAVLGRTQRNRPWRVAILISHPIQYFTPLYRRLNAEPDIDITVLFCSRQGLDKYHDTGFGVEVCWDVPLTEGYPHAFLPNLRRGGRELGGFFDLMNPAVLGWLRRDYDALWVNGHAYATYVASILAARAGGTHVLMRTDTHQGLSRSALKRMIRKPVLRGLYGSRASFLAIGSRNRDFYRALGIQADRIFVVPFAVENAFFRDRAREARTRRQEVRRRYGLPEEASIVLFASKLIEQKKPHHLLEAFAALLGRLPDAHLAFAGSGEMEITVRRSAASMGLQSKVSFLGFRNQSELPAVFAVSDVFVLPSVNEAWGLVINEAMAAGLPVVVSAEVGAVPDLVFDGRNGFSFPAGDTAALAEALWRVLRDPATAIRMGAESERIIATWSFEECVRGVRAALANGPRGRRDSGQAPAHGVGHDD